MGAGDLTAADVVMGEEGGAGGPAPEGRRRLYCPVLGCPEGNCARAQGWMDPGRLRAHLEGHAAGRFVGDVPAEGLPQMPAEPGG